MTIYNTPVTSPLQVLFQGYRTTHSTGGGHWLHQTLGGGKWDWRRQAAVNRNNIYFSNWVTTG